MAAYLSPVFGAGAQLFDNQGVVLSGGKITTYLAGTTTPLATWTDSTQVTANANPIILNSAGRLPNEMYLEAGSTYKLVLTDSSDNVLGTWDNIAGLNDITTSVTVSEWVATNLTPTYISSTSFSVSGNNTDTFTVNRRVQIVVSAGTAYGYVVSSTFSSPNTTVVIAPDSTVLDSGISSVSVGLLNASNPSVPNQYITVGSEITATQLDSGEVTVTAHATTGDIFAAAANSILWDDAAGAITTTIFPDASKAGMTRELRLNGESKFTAGANLLIPGVISGNTITLGAGALVKVRAITTTQFKLTYSYDGSFTITGTGFTSNPSGTAYFIIENGLVSLYVPSGLINETSNAVTFTLTGLPAALSPVSGQVTPVFRATDNGANVTAMGTITGGATVLSLFIAAGGNWTASGNKRLISTLIQWPLY